MLVVDAGGGIFGLWGIDFAGSSTVTALTEIVNRIPTAMSVVVSPNPSGLGQAVTFTAHIVTSSLLKGKINVVLSGTVTLKFSNSSVLVTPPLNGSIGSGTATFPTVTTSLGSIIVSGSYSGDANYAPSTAPNLTQTVLNATTTTLSSSVNPSAFGQAVTLTATVTGSGGTLSGAVSFRDGGVAIGSALLASGTAKFTTPALAGGSHSITATYLGNTAFAASTSAAVPQVVNQASTTTTLASSPTTAAFGQAVTFTTTVKKAVAGLLTGTVSFADGGTTIGKPVALNALGQAVFVTSALPVGSHSITATYSGNTDFAGSSTAGPLSETVNVIPTATSVVSSPNPLGSGQPVTLTAHISTPASLAGKITVPLTGTVTFTANGSSIGTAPVIGGNGSGTATFTTSSFVTLGPQTITAVYGGDSNYATSTSLAVTEKVLQPTATGISPSFNPVTFGQPVTFTAMVGSFLGGTPTGTVVFRQSSSVIGTVPLSGGQAIFTTKTLAGGLNDITATYSGDTTFAASVSNTLAETVDPAPSSTALAFSPNPAAFGQPVIITATVTSSAAGTPTGAVTFTDNGTPLGSAKLNSTAKAVFTTTSLTVGPHAILASYSGDSNFKPASVTLVENVKLIPTAISVVPSPDPSTLDQTATFTAHIVTSSLLKGKINVALTGTVNFFADGILLGSTTVAGSNGSGTATFTETGFDLGSYAITATYSGDPDYVGSTSAAVTQVVNP